MQMLAKENHRKKTYVINSIFLNFCGCLALKLYQWCIDGPCFGRLAIGVMKTRRRPTQSYSSTCAIDVTQCYFACLKRRDVDAVDDIFHSVRRLLLGLQTSNFGEKCLKLSIMICFLRLLRN